MEAISECIHERGNHGNRYVRCRILAAIRPAYALRQTRLVRRFGIADARAGKSRARLELARIIAELEQKRQHVDLGRASISAQRVRKLSGEQLQGVARFWVRQVLLKDDRGRQQGSTTMSSTSSVNIFTAHAPSCLSCLHGFLYL